MSPFWPRASSSSFWRLTSAISTMWWRRMIRSRALSTTGRSPEELTDPGCRRTAHMEFGISMEGEMTNRSCARVCVCVCVCAMLYAAVHRITQHKSRKHVSPAAKGSRRPRPWQALRTSATKATQHTTWRMAGAMRRASAASRSPQVRKARRISSCVGARWARAAMAVRKGGEGEQSGVWGRCSEWTAKKRRQVADVRKQGGCKHQSFNGHGSSRGNRHAAQNLSRKS